jgi:hypothetical protein
MEKRIEATCSPTIQKMEHKVWLSMVTTCWSLAMVACGAGRGWSD